MGVEEYYRPPMADLAVSQPLVRPRAVKVSMILMTLNMLITPVNYWLRPELLSNLTSVVLRFSVGLSFVFVFYLMNRIWHRRNWARIVFAVLALGGLFLGFHGVFAWLKDPSPASILNGLQHYLDDIAILLLFVKPSNAWFRGEEREHAPIE